MADIWLCGNKGCSHRNSKAWHRVMSNRIIENAGPRALADFEAAHPEPVPLCPVCGDETSRPGRLCFYCDDEPEEG